MRKDPVFRAQFHTMCANVGVDPLASNKGMWTQLLGFGDFYYELGVQIVEACLSTRPYNGGLMDLDSLRSFITVRSAPPGLPVSFPLLSAPCTLISGIFAGGLGRSRGLTWRPSGGTVTWRHCD